MYSLYVFFSFISLVSRAQDYIPPSPSTSSAYPYFLTASPALGDYSRFANGGPDANWYVGFNNAWIARLPPAPPGEFARAFLGAKLGRAKTRPRASKPWQREIIPGKVYIAVSPAAAFPSERSFFLADAEDIPAEPDPQAVVDSAGASEWFWAEVPVGLVASDSPNYLAVWSPTPWFIQASSSPILAAAEAEDPDAREPAAWNNRSILGVPPRSGANALETPLRSLLPALAVMLVPPAPPNSEPALSAFSAERTSTRLVARFAARGEDIVEAWIEASRDQLDWARASRMTRRPPFSFSLSGPRAPAPGSWIRGAARDLRGRIGYSEPLPVPHAAR